MFVFIRAACDSKVEECDSIEAAFAAIAAEFVAIACVFASSPEECDSNVEIRLVTEDLEICIGTDVALVIRPFRSTDICGTLVAEP